MLPVRLQRHGASPLGADADDEADLRLDVQLHRGAEHRRGVGGCLPLAAGPRHVRAGDHHRPGAAVVTDGQVLPVGGERGGGVGAEDAADVGGVVLAGVEVDVVTDLERQVQFHRGEGVGVPFHGRVAGRVGDPGGERLAHPRPGRPAGRQQGVQRRAGQQGGVRGAQLRGEGTGVQDVVAEADADTAGRPARREDTVRKVVRTEGVAFGEGERERGGLGHLGAASLSVRSVGEHTGHRRPGNRAARKPWAGPHVTCAAPAGGGAAGGGRGSASVGPVVCRASTTASGTGRAPWGRVWSPAVWQRRSRVPAGLARAGSWALVVRQRRSRVRPR
ncbi:hypothetical protein SDIAM103S_02330 [Streptomyces diastaticus subsp. diastaticus]